MSEFFEKLSAIASEVARERGEFTLFAIMHRRNAPDSWDVVVAAPWLDTEGMKDYRYLTGKLVRFFTWGQGPDFPMFRSWNWTIR